MLPDWFHQLGLMAWPLAACSVLTVMICFERLFFYCKVFISKNKTRDKLSNYLTEHKTLSKSSRDELATLMIQELQTSCFSGTRLLRTIGMISPILGLLGTILGIIAAFKVIAVQTGPVSPSMIADGLWEAMLTTAAGLMIALPALVMSYLFHFLAERHLNGLCLHLNRLSLSFEIDMHEQEPEIMHDNVKRLSA